MEIKKVLFDVYFEDLTSAAQQRYCKTYGIQPEELVNFPIALAEGYVSKLSLTDDQAKELCEELQVDKIIAGPIFELWKLSNEGVEHDELVTDAPASIEDARRYAAERGITSTDDYEVVIEEVYEVRDEPEGETYFKARTRETI